MTFLLVLLCFLASGFAALLYETAWTREFAFVFGTSELAVAAVLAAYMGGLALGAALASRFAHRLRRPVLVYGLLELGIALGALAVPYGIGALRWAYLTLVGGLQAPPESLSLATSVFHLAGAFVVLVPCTAMMGATLPLLARQAVERDDQVGSRVGLLYAVNTFGAIAGTLAAAFVLLPSLGLRRTVYVGVAVNALVFLLATGLARTAPLRPGSPGDHRVPFVWILPAMAISGAASFAYEVLWVRLLGFVLGGSTAAFSTMLASFLLGIALGSAISSRFATTRARAASGFAVAQLATAFLASLAFLAADQLPELGRMLGASPTDLGPGALLAGALLLPMTLCIGATFPLAVRLATPDPERVGGSSARVYAWNTVGSIFGAVGTAYVLLPLVGFEGTVALAATANLLLAAAASLASAPRRRALAVAALAGVLLLGLFPPQPPEQLLATSALSGRHFPGSLAHVGVGRSGTVALLEEGTRWRIATNGLPESSIERPESPPGPFTVVRWLSLLPVLARPDADRVLVVGLGGGVTVSAVPASVDAIDVIELEHEVVVANEYARPRAGRDPLEDPRVRVLLGDARGTLMLTDAHYDAIISQPSHPWTAGASHLYTKEFFELVRARLVPDGVFIQWIGLSFVDEGLLRSLLASLGGVFEHVEVYRPAGAGIVFAASAEPFEIPRHAAAALAAAPDDFAIEGIHRTEDAIAPWVLDAAGSRALASGAPPNTDDHNRMATSRRSARGPGSRAWVAELMRAHDPLPEAVSTLEVASVIRRLGALQQLPRASALAESLAGAQAEMARGWVKVEAGQKAEAARAFRRALALEPGLRPAAEGLALLTSDDTIPGLSDRAQAVARGQAAWRSRAKASVAELDPALALWEPGDLLYVEAAGLRALWRLESDDPARAHEALELIDEILTRRHRPSLLLLRARAAVGAGLGPEAWASLASISARNLPGDRGRALARQALDLARQLEGPPPDEAILTRLRAAAGA